MLDDDRQGGSSSESTSSNPPPTPTRDSNDTQIRTENGSTDVRK
ncbi:MAG: hypothetical protein QG594_806 [Bacteroidota bacterium]|jgi:hypothetical protein|nr:hypothetical protein [Bacteroidota bacterium]